MIVPMPPPTFPSDTSRRNSIAKGICTGACNGFGAGGFSF
jgi:hypothetical protein